MTTSVHALDLEEVDVLGLERDELIAAFQAAGEKHWLVKVPNGYAVTRHRHATAVLRDKRFHSALAVIT